MKRVLTIAASDSSAASGVQGDLKVFSRCGVYGTCAVALIAAQDTYTVRKLFRLAPGIVGAQIDAVVADIGADACKIGWYRCPELTTVIARRLVRRDLRPVVLDPCLWSTRGEALTPPRTVKRMVRELLPRATVLTVTVAELGVLAGLPVGTAEERREAAARALSLGPEAVVVEDAPAGQGTEVQVVTAGGTEAVGSAPWGIAGAGSIFSAALTAALAQGKAPAAAAAFALEIVAAAAAESQPLGHGAPVGL